MRSRRPISQRSVGLPLGQRTQKNFRTEFDERPGAQPEKLAGWKPHYDCQKAKNKPLHRRLHRRCRGGAAPHVALEQERDMGTFAKRLMKDLDARKRR